MRSKSYCINIPPIAWQRAVRNGNRLYNTHTRDKVSFGLHLSQQHNEEPFFEKPIKLEVTFYLPLPKTQNPNRPYSFCNNPPYLSNLYSFLLDAIKDIIIKDSRVICSLSLKKVYDKEPRTELVITEVG